MTLSINFVDLWQNFDENLILMFPGPQEKKSSSKIFAGILYVFKSTGKVKILILNAIVLAWWQQISDIYLEIVVKIFRLNFLSYRTQNIYQSWDSPSFFPLSCQKHYIITRTNDAFIIKWVALLNSDCPVNKKGKKKGGE